MNENYFSFIIKSRRSMSIEGESQVPGTVGYVKVLFFRIPYSKK